MEKRESIQQKQYPQGIGRNILGTTEGNTTDDIQGGKSIIKYDAPVWSTNLRDTNYKTSNMHRARLSLSPLAVTIYQVSNTLLLLLFA